MEKSEESTRRKAASWGIKLSARLNARLAIHSTLGGYEVLPSRNPAVDLSNFSLKPQHEPCKCLLRYPSACG